jgi:hypothetical protein
MADQALAKVEGQAVATVPALSQSGLKDLAVSPLRYWYWWVNPDRPEEEETPAMVFGSALHVATLQPDLFPQTYYCALNPEDYPDLLTTIGDMRGWLDSHGIKAKGTLKADVMAQVRSHFPNVPILDALKEEHATKNFGKTELSVECWQRVLACRQALHSEPEFLKLLRDGEAEVKLTAQDPETGVWLSGTLDYPAPGHTLDVKTFTVKREKSVDRAVADAIYYEKYHWQAWMYAKLRALTAGDSSKSGPQTAPRHICAFVESEPPHEVRLAELRPRIHGEASQLWLKAQIECTGLIRLYASCVERYGDKPWRHPQRPEAVLDEEIPALIYSR